MFPESTSKICFIFTFLPFCNEMSIIFIQMLFYLIICIPHDLFCMLCHNYWKFKHFRSLHHHLRSLQHSFPSVHKRSELLLDIANHQNCLVPEQPMGNHICCLIIIEEITHTQLHPRISKQTLHL